MSMTVAAEISVLHNPSIELFPASVWTIVPSIDGGIFNVWNTGDVLDGGSFWSGGDVFDGGGLSAETGAINVSIVMSTPEIILLD